MHQDAGLAPRLERDGSPASQAPALWTAPAEASSDGLIVVSPQGRILARNRRFGEVWGLTTESLEDADDEAALAAAQRLVLDPVGFTERVHAIYANPVAATHDEIRLRDGRVLDRFGTPLHDAGGTCPEDVLRELNSTLVDEPDLGERFASAIYACLEQDVCGAWLTMAVAGHPLPIVVRRAGWVDTRGQPGTLLGLFDDIEVGEDRVGLGPGDAIVFFTDGVTEARNDAGEEYADEALPEVLLSNTDADAEQLADAVVAGLERFTARPPVRRRRRRDGRPCARRRGRRCVAAAAPGPGCPAWGRSAPGLSGG